MGFYEIGLFPLRPVSEHWYALQMMTTPPTVDIAALVATDISGLPDEAALNCIGELVDAAGDLGQPAATTRAFDLLDAFVARTPPPGDDLLAAAHYFRANAWHNRRIENGRGTSWLWEQEELQNEILELRRAANHVGFPALHPVQQCQVLTNLASQLDSVGRFIEAIAYWDDALVIEPRFARALGNRGRGFLHYASAVYDDGHAGLLLSEAHGSLTRATAPDAVWDGDARHRPHYMADIKGIESGIDVSAIRMTIALDEAGLGRSRREREYRSWCLRHRLFMNPLNDLGPHSIAAQDVLTLPSTSTDFEAFSAAPPAIYGFFNQMKQEFVSARFTLFEGMTADRSHYSDHDVLLYNTLDYPAYGLSTERVRSAFRAIYSLFDKVAFFLNFYLGIGLKPAAVSFDRVWREIKGTRKLLSRFDSHPNWPLRGLYWVSKDLYEPDAHGVTDPDASELSDLRNYLEHRYVQMHELNSCATLGTSGDLAQSILRNRFEDKTLHLAKLARAALIYLSLAVHREEAMAQSSKPVPDQARLTAAVPLHVWDDRWKR